MDDHEQFRMLGAGGNLDDRRIGVGASMYYPVAVEGALLSMGDAHSAQGDSEFDGEYLALNSPYILCKTLHFKQTDLLAQNSPHALKETDLLLHT